jgi:Zn ribbon nucleic-acid-binding protein
MLKLHKNAFLILVLILCNNMISSIKVTTKKTFLSTVALSNAMKKEYANLKDFQFDSHEKTIQEHMDFFTYKLKQMKKLASIAEEHGHVLSKEQLKNIENFRSQIESLEFSLFTHYQLYSKEQEDKEKVKKINEEVLTKIEEIKNDAAINANLLQTHLAEASKAVGVKADYGLKFTAACTNGVLSQIPADFCYKRGGDFGVIPTLCDCGYFRFLALCYRDCPAGYYFLLGVCWSACPSGYTDIGLLCISINGIVAKNSFISESKTNFDAVAICPQGMYKGGALCYRDCNKIGLVNCGIGACASSEQECSSRIAGMVVNTIVGLGTALAFVCSFGASSAGTTGIAAMKSTITNAIKGMKKSIIDITKRISTKAITKKGFIKGAINAAKDYFKDTIQSVVEDQIVAAVCGKVADSVLQKTQGASAVGFNVAALDVTGISSLGDSCGDTSTENGRIGCASAVIGVLANFDPTGLLGIASALMQPICDV